MWAEKYATDNLHRVKHPLIDCLVTKLRDHRTGRAEFTQALNDVSSLLTLEAARQLETQIYGVETPLDGAIGVRTVEPTTVVPILRAGLGMLDGFLWWLPDSRVGFIGIERGEFKKVYSHEPYTGHHVYYKKLPHFEKESRIYVLDPMLATGGSACEALSFLKSEGASQVTQVSLLSVVAAPEGLEMVQERHPDVDIFVAAIDRCLDENFYIRPGLGDAGDRVFGT